MRRVIAASWPVIVPLVAAGVFWGSARSDGWVTLCSFAAIAVWVRDSERGTRHGALAYPVLLAIALGFKESAAIFPIQMALVAWAWPGPRPRGLWLGVA